jgi:hypothetical protein
MLLKGFPSPPPPTFRLTAATPRSGVEDAKKRRSIPWKLKNIVSTTFA